MPTIKVDLRAEAFQSNTEYTLDIPPGTTRAVLSTPGRFPIRFSLNPGEVTGSNLRGKVVRDEFDTKTIDATRGPIYFAAKQPRALLNVSCQVTASASGRAFSSAFSSAFGVTTSQSIVNRFGKPIYTNQGRRVVKNE